MTGANYFRSDAREVQLENGLDLGGYCAFLVSRLCGGLFAWAAHR
jgi:hypothetical protein